MALIDFSSCPVINTKLYGGSNGKKIGIIFNNEKYLLKFSSKNNGNFSSDNSLTILEGYSRKDSRIKIINLLLIKYLI